MTPAERKILHLRSSSNVLGAESVIIELCKHTQHYGYTPIVGAFKEKDSPVPEFLDYLPSHTERVVFHCRGRLDISLPRRIRNFIEANNVAIVHCHGYKADFYAIQLGGRVVRFATNHLWKRSDLKGRAYAALDAFLLRFFDCSVAVSCEIAQEMKKKKIPLIHTIENGIDTERFSPREKSISLLDAYGLTAENCIIGMISSLTPEKAHLAALRALKKIIAVAPHIKLLIVGDGRSKDEIASGIRDLDLSSHVILAGKQHDIPVYLSLVDIFLLPSLQEGLPMALLEAMAAGRCVVASRVGEIPNIIEHGKNGLLVSPGNAEEIAEAIQRLLVDAELARACRREAIQTVRERYSSTFMTRRYCQLYDAVLQARELS